MKRKRIFLGFLLEILVLLYIVNSNFLMNLNKPLLTPALKVVPIFIEYASIRLI